MLKSNYTACLCRNSCCPTIDVYAGEEGEYVVIKDDYEGSVKITYAELEMLHAHYLQSRYGVLQAIVKMVKTLAEIVAKKYA